MDEPTLKEAIDYAQEHSGNMVMVETKGYLKKTATHRKVRWVDGEPWVTIRNLGFKIVGYRDLVKTLGMEGDPVYLFITL